MGIRKNVNVAEEPINYQPSGSMCCNCTHKLRDCSHIDFESMRQIRKVKNSVIVKCDEFEKGQK